jgi:MerR family transcriptional regulator, light-induced transcriptional regulator
MATVFGISGLKSKLDGWRASRREIESTTDKALAIPAGSFDFAGGSSDEQDLSLLLENLVIPRLIADRSKATKWLDSASLLHAGQADRSGSINKADVEDFAQLSLTADAHELLDFVDHCLESGSSVEMIYVELLAPAARRLGEYWDADNEDFVGVTMGLWRIQEILRELTLRIPPKSGAGHGQRSALFSAMPGEQHSFGTLMISECFQRAGWETDALIEPTRSELTAKFAKQHYDLIGLTISCDCSTGALGSLISTIKAVSVNPQIRIMIGGRVVNEQPMLVVECGADATATDACAAVELADRLVPLNVEYFEKLS